MSLEARTANTDKVTSVVKTFVCQRKLLTNSMEKIHFQLRGVFAHAQYFGKEPRLFPLKFQNHICGLWYWIVIVPLLGESPCSSWGRFSGSAWSAGETLLGSWWRMRQGRAGSRSAQVSPKTSSQQRPLELTSFTGFLVAKRKQWQARLESQASNWAIQLAQRELADSAHTTITEWCQVTEK